MLVLSRFPGETIRVGEDISVTVLSVSSHGKVRLGFTAPPSVAILREELGSFKERREGKDAIGGTDGSV